MRRTAMVGGCPRRHYATNGRCRTPSTIGGPARLHLQLLVGGDRCYGNRRSGAACGLLIRIIGVLIMRLLPSTVGRYHISIYLSTPGNTDLEMTLYGPSGEPCYVLSMLTGAPKPQYL
jgi:hypothetical protein